jgi:hypothetical protein
MGQENRINRTRHQYRTARKGLPKQDCQHWTTRIGPLSMNARERRGQPEQDC